MLYTALTQQERGNYGSLSLLWAALGCDSVELGQLSARHEVSDDSDGDMFKHSHTSIAERAQWCTRGSRWSPPSTTKRAAGRSGSAGSASSRLASCSVLYRGAEARAGEVGGDQSCQGRDVCQYPVQQVRQRGRTEAGNWVSLPLGANTGIKDSCM